MDEVKIEIILKDMLDSIKAITENKPDGHFALKLTALISIDTMSRLSSG